MIRSFEERPRKIAVIGDIHDLWEAETDRACLEALAVDLVLFVGDLGNESVEVARAIAELDFPKAVVLGNHDAWYTASEWGRRKCPYDHEKEDRVRDQLELLGEAHVGYGKRDFPELGLSVVGSRPFSWGGPDWKNQAFYRERYGVRGFEESTDRVVAAVKETACRRVIFLAHNGPLGLGDKPEDPCGRDWKPGGGDHGDPDLAAAIARARELGKTIPLVAFGHMHHRLRHTDARERRALVEGENGTIYFNSANVPRIVEGESDRQRNFPLVELTSEGVSRVSLVWTSADGTVTSERVFHERQAAIARSAG